MENSKLSDLILGSQLESNALSLGLLGLRLYGGYTIMRAGLDKIPLPSWMTEQVVQMGMPAPEFFAWVATFTEFAFGLLLVLGLLTRISGLMLAITMGMATFLFHGLYPIVSMHIAQHFFWIFALFAFVGGGKFSLDYLLAEKFELGTLKTVGIGGIAILSMLGYGLYYEYNAPPEQPNQANVINSVNIPGSFNEWNPKANKMTEKSDGNYEFVREFEKSGVIEFKFTINGTWQRNFGEVDQEKEGFPLKGVAEETKDNNTKNIRTFLPEPGKYRFSVNIKSREYKVEKAD